MQTASHMHACMVITHWCLRRGIEVVLLLPCRARAVMEEARRAGFRVDSVHYTMLLNAHGRAGQVQAAAAVLKEMRQEGIQPTPRSYTSMMNWWVHMPV